jgi:3-hydroxyacyl-[acyl-carrier-protein] dehydratase
MDIRKIQECLPHRFPMLLVDRIEELEKGKRVRGYKNVTYNEEFFQGHYPNMPIMPGVLILESMAQVSAMIMLSEEAYEGYTPLIVGLDKVKFRRPVVPGDKLETEAELQWFRSQVGSIKATARVDGEIACQAEISFKILLNGEKI